MDRIVVIKIIIYALLLPFSFPIWYFLNFALIKTFPTLYITGWISIFLTFLLYLLFYWILFRFRAS